MLGVSFCGLVLIVQAAVKAEVERDGALEPSSAAGSDCQGHNRRTEPGVMESRGSAAGQTPITC